MRLVFTPTEDWLREGLVACHSQLIVSSPYVTGILPVLLNELHPETKKLVVTRTDLRDFAMGASDISAVCSLARQGVDVRSLARLHAKVYVIDRRQALVTSANATESGLRRNLECGLAVDDPAVAVSLAEAVEAGFGAEQAPLPWTALELEALRDAVTVVKENLPRLPPSQVVHPETIRVPISDQSARSQLVDSVSGWTSLVLEGVLSLGHDVFSLDELLPFCSPLATRRYPRNRHVRPKLRQQLQRLRDLGCIEFLGGGVYRRTIGVSTNRPS